MIDLNFSTLCLLLGFIWGAIAAFGTLGLALEMRRKMGGRSTATSSGGLQE